MNVTSRLAAFTAAIFVKNVLQSMEKYPFFVILALRLDTAYSIYENAIKYRKLHALEYSSNGNDPLCESEEPLRFAKSYLTIYVRVNTALREQLCHGRESANESHSG